MGKLTVKQKVPVCKALGTLAVLTFLLSFFDLLPAAWIEAPFARSIFPTVSHISSAADTVPFSLLDVWIVGMMATAALAIRFRRFQGVVSAAALSYLWFFWTWGIYYHRVPVERRLGLEAAAPSPADYRGFVEQAASELNRLHPIVARTRTGDGEVAAFAAARVKRVTAQIDHRDWSSPERIKHSLMAQGWFLIAGIDGMFNPFGHEPLINSGLLGIELPFVMAHELAHVRGVANEGEANFVAVLATLASGDPGFQYSGWMHLWFYLRNSERDRLLDPGPQADFAAIVDRMRSQQIRWVANVQSAILDLHLKANDVPGGIESYARIVELAIASRPDWPNYR